MTHNGKIGRLPKAIQDQLNHRLQNNELGQPLLVWLNGLPEVRQILDMLFDGVPISKHNLSQWRKGGFREWQACQEALKLVPDIVSQADELQPTDGETLADKLAPWLAGRFYVIARTMLNDDGMDKFKTLRALCGDLAALRRADHRLAQLKLNRERLSYEQEQAAENPSQPRAVAPSRSE